jgi:hypothetical protein
MKRARYDRIMTRGGSSRVLRANAVSRSASILPSTVDDTATHKLSTRMVDLV